MSRLTESAGIFPALLMQGLAAVSWERFKMLRKYNRRHSRAEIEWPTTVLTEQGHVEAKLKSLGADGAYIYCEQTSRPRNFVPITIRPPNHTPLKITAEVVWADKGLSPGMGVRFAEISEIDRRFLTETISKHYERKIARKFHNEDAKPDK